MQLKFIKTILLFAFTFSLTIAQTSETNSEFFNWLKTKPGIEIKKVSSPDSMFSESYEVMIEQPLDHENPESPKFKQQVFVSLHDKNRPVIFVTEGYEAFNWTYELSKILDANQIIVEHRYFAESTPDSSIFDWKYLTIKQAAADHHAIVQLFKEYFNGKWVNTGISKGGQTTMYHRRFYPDDVDASVPYVGPLAFAPADDRVHTFIDNVSTRECRKKVHDFQALALKNRDELIKIFYADAEVKGYTYSIGFSEAFEYGVLEYSFAYWQWGDGDCDRIPDSTASLKDIYDQLSLFGTLDYFSDAGIKAFEPFFYQAFTQLGYYDYDITEFNGLIEYIDGSNKCFYPEDFIGSFDPSAMLDINNWIQNEGDKFIFIYGENDPWSACAVELTGNTNSIKMVLEGGNHTTRINSFPEDQRKIIIDKLEEWLDIDIN
ncbi:MAG: S28 family serine protease [bacterium]